MLPIVQHIESFKYLGKYVYYAMDNSDHKHQLLSETKGLLEEIDIPPSHPRFKLELYGKYLLPKISWHLTIADINITWVKQTLDLICHSKFRSWLEIHAANGSLDILLEAKYNFGLNIIDISKQDTQCQTILRNKLKNSKCCDIRSVHNDWSKESNIQYDRHLSAKDALKEIRKVKISNTVTNIHPNVSL